MCALLCLHRTSSNVALSSTTIRGKPAASRPSILLCFSGEALVYFFHPQATAVASYM